MPATVAVFLLATLPIAQAPYAPTPGEPASPKPNRRILAPEYPRTLRKAPNRPPAASNRTTHGFAMSDSSIRSTAGQLVIMA